MMEAPNRWNDLRRIADEIQLKIHLAEMDARDRWNELQPRIAEVEHKIAEAGDAATGMTRELSELGAALRELSQDVVMRMRGDYLRGW